MYKDVSHFLNKPPWCLGMCILECLSEFIACFTYNLNIVSCCVKTNFVSSELFFFNVICVLINIVY